MEYSNDSNDSNDRSTNQILNQQNNIISTPLGYFYVTRYNENTQFPNTLIPFDTLQSIPQINSIYNNYLYNESNINNQTSISNLYYNSIFYDIENTEFFNINSGNERNDSNDSNNSNDSNGSNDNNQITYNEISTVFIPTVNFIERIFNDYIHDKNKLNDEEYKNNVEKINEILEECPVCFTSSETTIKIKKCNHVFCEDCIQKWLKSHKNTCPICRVNVIIEPENSNGNRNTNNENSNE